MNIIYLVTLFIIGATANVLPRQSKGCECDSFISQNGWGDCKKSEPDGRTLCYVKDPKTSTCPDLKASTTDIGKSWSYKACEYATNNKPTTSVIKLSPENSLCDQMKAKSFSKLDTEEECRNAVDEVRKVVTGAKFMRVETAAEGAGFPRGCYLWVPNSGIYFNNNNVRTHHKSARQVCKEDGISVDCDRDSDCVGQETCQGGKCGCGAGQSCTIDKSAPTCNNGQCICGLNDVDGNGVATFPVNSCRQQQAPTCSNAGNIENPANFKCVCGSKGPCKAGTICEKDVNGKEKCVVKCPAACLGNERCDLFHQICRCGALSSCKSFSRGPVCNANRNLCVCNLAANIACAAGERCEIRPGNAAGNRCTCGNNPSCGGRGQCVEGVLGQPVCLCGNNVACTNPTPACANNVCRRCAVATQATDCAGFPNGVCTAATGVCT